MSQASRTQQTAAESLTRVPLSSADLPPLDPPRPAWPGEVREVGGVGLHVRATPGAEDATAVYVHGLGGSATNWTDLATALAPNARGLAVDLPGFGFSEPEDGYGYTLAEHAETLYRFVSGLDGGPVHLFGNSMGGAVGLLVAAKHPELVRTLTLVSPAMPDLRPYPSRISDPRIPLAALPVLGKPIREKLANMTPRERVDQVIRLCFHEPDAVPACRLEEAEAEAAARLGFGWAGQAMNKSAAGIIRTWLAPRPRSLWTVASEIRVPTLVIWGQRDRVISVRRARRTARVLPNGRLLVLPRTGHVAQMERPASVARAVLGMWESVAEGTW